MSYESEIFGADVFLIDDSLYCVNKENRDKLHKVCILNSFVKIVSLKDVSQWETSMIYPHSQSITVTFERQDLKLVLRVYKFNSNLKIFLRSMSALTISSNIDYFFKLTKKLG